jgi:hypothetical protein
MEVVALELGLVALELEGVGRVASWELLGTGVVKLTKVPEF